MSRSTKIAAATLALSLLAATLAFAGEVFVTDEWNLPVYVTGAKGAPVQATMPGQFTNGVAAMTGSGGNIDALMKGSEAWTRQADPRDHEPTYGTDWENRW